MLKELGSARGVQSRYCRTDNASGSKVSGTRVRNTIEKGDVEFAAKLLGRPFTMRGQVVEGLGLGRSLGIQLLM